MMEDVVFGRRGFQLILLLLKTSMVHQMFMCPGSIHGTIFVSFVKLSRDPYALILLHYNYRALS